MLEQASPAGDTEPIGSGDQSTARLYLIPVPLGETSSPADILPADTIRIACALRHFVAENARSARAVLSALPLIAPLQSLSIRELNRHTPPAEIPDLLAPALAGQSIGLLSEAGCPAVADPGAAVVALAHQRGIPVVPLVGPSAILLAVMAGGMNGQSFAFVGYLPVDPQERRQRIRQLEQRSAVDAQTQLMIETPYRNQAIFDALLETLAPQTQLSVAMALTLPGEQIRTMSVAQWRRSPPTLPREPAIFSLLAAPLAQPKADRRAGSSAQARPVASAQGAGRGTLPSAGAGKGRRRR